VTSRKKGPSDRTMLNLVTAESVLAFSPVGICVAVMTVFWNSVGMNQAMIGLSQTAFTLAMILFDIPMGYLADRFNRRLLNIAGDFGCAAAFLLYAGAGGFWGVLVCEILCGLFMSMTSGVDRALMKYYCDRIDAGGDLFRKKSAGLSGMQFSGLIAAVLVGMAVSRVSVAWTLRATAVPFLAAGVLACLVPDIGERLETRRRGAFGDALQVFRDLTGDRRRRVLMLGYALSREITHPVIWAFTPLMIMVGVPVWIVGAGYILSYLFSVLGAKLSEKTVRRPASFKFVFPVILTTLGLGVVLLRLNIFTVWFFTLTGIAQGYSQAALAPELQEETPDAMQTSVMSAASTLCRLVYMPAVSLANALANDNPRVVFAVTLLLFLPLSVPVCILLKTTGRASAP